MADPLKALFRAACMASAMLVCTEASAAAASIQTRNMPQVQSMQHPKTIAGTKPTWKDTKTVEKPAIYDQIIAASIARDSKTVEYVVNAAPQADKYGYGAGYFVSGLTKSDHWYQVALVYDWPGHQPNHAYYFKGFYMSFDCFYVDNSGNKRGIVGMRKFDGKVNPGDRVDLKLSFSENKVIMVARDLNTNSTASVSLESGDKLFVGANDFVSAWGFFTGIITERYSTSQAFGDLNPVTYHPIPKSSSPAYIFEMEYNPLGDELFRSSIIHLANSYGKKYTYLFERGNQTYYLEYGPFGKFTTKSNTHNGN